MRMRLPELYNDYQEAKKLMSEKLPKGWEDNKQVLHYKDLPYVSKVICLDLISRHYNTPFAGYFDIEKTQELIARKYYWPMLQQDIKVYIKSCNICLASRAVCNKLYGDLKLLPVSIYW